MHKPKVSVIIPAYNSHKTIGSSIEGLMKQTAFNSIDEIIIVDSSDDPDSLKLLDELKKLEKVFVLTSGVRVMPAIQRNIGAKYAKAEILCFLDSDAFPSDQWVEKIISAYLSGIRVGGGSYRLPDFQLNSKVAKAQYYLEFNEWFNLGVPREKKMIPTCNLFCERQLFYEVGGFPELRAAEDTLFGIRIRQHSAMIFYPENFVYHIFRETTDHYYKNQMLLGKFNFIHRKLVYNSIIYKGICPYILFPVFVIFKMARILGRISFNGLIHLKDFIPVFGLFCAGLFNWSKGFWNGMRAYQNEESFLALKKCFSAAYSPMALKKSNKAVSP